MISKKGSQIPDSLSLAISTQVKALRAQGERVISFGAGQPDFDTPQVIKEGAIHAIEHGYTGYTPVAGIPELRKEICHWFKKTAGVAYNPQEILVSNGAKQCIYNLLLATIDESDEVLLPVPYWLSYPEQIKMAGGQVKKIFTSEENHFKLTPEELEKSLSPRSKLLILNSPSNPTGALYSKEEILPLLEILLSRGIYLLSDEIYSQLVYDGQTCVSPISVHPKARENTLVVNGVSKAYAMTGWRIGFSAGPADIISAASRLQAHSTSGACSISQYAALTALQKGQSEVEKMRDEFQNRRNYMFQRLEKMAHIQVFQPRGAFYFFPKISFFYGKTYGDVLIDGSLAFGTVLLKHKKVALIPGKAFGLNSHIRLSYATSMEDIREGLDRLEEFLGELQN